MKIVISPGHGLKIRGASYKDPSGWGLDEVHEARRCVPALAEALRKRGHQVEEVYDNTSTTQDQNLAYLVSEHNSRDRDLDISWHFNSAEPSPNQGAIGTECFYQTQEELAGEVSGAISDALGIPDRGAKYGNLYFLSNTDRPAILVECCFVMAKEDCEAYEAGFNDMIEAIASIRMKSTHVEFAGTCSWFGGPADAGVSADEDLAWWESWEQVETDGAGALFLPEQPPNTSGMARRLNPDQSYIACRWDYDVTPKTMLKDQRLWASVYAPKTKRREFARPSDWGPHEEETGRAADLSPALMERLGITTDDEVHVIYPATTKEK